MTDHRNSILHWAEQGRLAPGSVEQAMREAGELPSRSDWRGFIDRLLLWGGAMLLAVGVIFFFAYNWSELGRVARLGLAELLVAVAVAWCGWFGTERPAGKASLFVAAVLTGALLALFGQTYQTGADTFELFITWAVRHSPLDDRRPPARSLGPLDRARQHGDHVLFQGISRPVRPALQHGKRALAAVRLQHDGAGPVGAFQQNVSNGCANAGPPVLLGFASGSLITTLAMFAIFDHKEDSSLRPSSPIPCGSPRSMPATGASSSTSSFWQEAF